MNDLPACFKTLNSCSYSPSIERLRIVNEYGGESVSVDLATNTYTKDQEDKIKQLCSVFIDDCSQYLVDTERQLSETYKGQSVDTKEMPQYMSLLVRVSEGVKTVEKFLNSNVGKACAPFFKVTEKDMRDRLESQRMQLKQRVGNQIESIQKLLLDVTQKNIPKSSQDYIVALAIFNHSVKLTLNDKIDVAAKKLQPVFIKCKLLQPTMRRDEIKEWVEEDPDILNRMMQLPLDMQNQLYLRFTIRLLATLPKTIIRTNKQYLELYENLNKIKDENLRQRIQAQENMTKPAALLLVLELSLKGEAELAEKALKLIETTPMALREGHCFKKLFDHLYPLFKLLPASKAEIGEKLDIAHDMITKLPQVFWLSPIDDWKSALSAYKADPQFLQRLALINLSSKYNVSILDENPPKEEPDERKARTRFYRLAQRNLPCANQFLSFHEKYRSKYQKILSLFWDNFRAENLEKMKFIFDWAENRLAAKENPDEVFSDLNRCGHFFDSSFNEMEPLLYLPAEKIAILKEILDSKANITLVTKEEIKNIFEKNQEIDLFRKIFEPHSTDSWIKTVQEKMEKSILKDPYINLVDQILIQENHKELATDKISLEEKLKAFKENTSELLSRLASLDMPKLKAILAFSAKYPYQIPILGLIQFMELDDELGFRCATLATEKPELITDFFKLLNGHGIDILKDLLTEWEKGNRELAERLISRSSLSTNFFNHSLFMLEINPKRIGEWFELERLYGEPILDAIDVNINKLEKNIVKLLEDDKLRDAFIVWIKSGKPDMGVLIKALEENLDSTLEVLERASGNARAIKLFLDDMIYLKNSSTYVKAVKLSIIQLDPAKELEKRIIDRIVDFMVANNKDVALLYSLIALIDKKDFDLADRLLDMVHAGYDSEAQALLQCKQDIERSHVKDTRYLFNEKLLALSGSVNAPLIKALLAIDLKANESFILKVLPHIGYDSTPLIIKNAIILASQGKITLSQEILAANDKPLNAQSNRDRALVEFAGKGNFAMAEFALAQPEIKSKDALSADVQSQFWDISKGCEKVLKNKPTSEMANAASKIQYFCQALALKEISQQDLRDVLGIVQFAARQNILELSNKLDNENIEDSIIQLKSFFASRNPELLLAKRLEAVEKHTFPSVYQKEKALEAAYSIGLAECLITIGGSINTYLIDQLQDFATFKKIPFHTDYHQYLKAVLQDFNQDTQGIGYLLSTAKSPEQTQNPVHKVIRKMLGKLPSDHLTDWDAQIVILSGLLTRLRQHDEIGSCFGTQTAINTQDDKLLFALRDYMTLVADGEIRREQQGKNKGFRSYPLIMNTTDLEKDVSDQNHLARSREYTISQMSFTEDQNLLTGKTLPLFTAKDSDNPLYLRLQKAVSFQDPKKEALHEDDYLQAFKDTFNSMIKCMYDPSKKWPTADTRGAWFLCYRENDQKILTPEEYNQLIIKIVETAEKALVNKITDIKKKDLIENTLKQLKSEIGLNFDLISEILKKEKGSDQVKDPVKDHESLSEKPWVLYCGGSGFEVFRQYFEQIAVSPTSTCLELNPQGTLEAILTYTAGLPEQLKNWNSQSSYLLPVTFNGKSILQGGHAFNLKLHQAIANLQAHKHPKDIINEMKKNAQDIRSMPINDELKKALIDAFAAALGPMESTFKQTAGQITKSANTVGEFCQQCLHHLKIINGVSTTENFDFKLEKILREKIIELGKRPPEVLPIADLNWNAEGHNNVYLGFGCSILTGEIMKFLCYDEGHVPPKPVYRALASGYWQFYEPASIAVLS